VNINAIAERTARSASATRRTIHTIHSWEITMNKGTDEDEGTIEAVLERLNELTLPRALDIRARVDRGESLDENEMQFLKRELEDANSAQPLAARHPEYQMLYDRLVSLYGDITRKALENEKASK
jgi:hypothetical protein